MSTQATHGYIPDIYDPSDRPYQSKMSGKMENHVNLLEKYADWLRPVYSQLHTETCVANATAAAFRYLARKLEPSPHSHLFEEDPSRLFIYYNARVLSNLFYSENKEVYENVIKNGRVPAEVDAVTDTGSMSRYAFKSISRLGVCNEKKTWPFAPLDPAIIDGRTVQNQIPRPINERPEDVAYDKAKAVKVGEYCRLDPDHPDKVEEDMSKAERNQVGQKTLQNLKKCLTEGYPAAIGFSYYWKNLDLAATESKGFPVLTDIPADRRDIGPERDENGRRKWGGHTVLAIGYDDGDNTVLIQNSWGADDTAYFKMPYSWITDWEATNDFWMVREMV